MVDLIAALDRAPRPVRRIARRIAAGEGILGRLADRVRFPYSDDEVPPLPADDGASTRLLIGPNNTAGQGFMWARAVEREHADTSAVSAYGFGSNTFEAAVDLRIPENVYLRSGSWHDTFEQYLASRTHVVWESGLPMLGRRYGMSAAAEVRRLADRGVAGALLFHGSDIRPPSLHAASNLWSPFTGSSRDISRLEEDAERNAALAASLGVPCFVSTPDLLRWLPEATWCPVVVDPSQWHAVSARGSGRPVVAHAPSNTWIKGTDLIEPVLHRLDDEGVIEYRQIVGVRHADMPAFYAEADVVLDQFTLGIYGVAACEALASGRLVMSHVDDLTRTEVRDRTGLDLPVHETTLQTLESELRRYAAEPDAFSGYAVAGPAFVAAVHDGRRSAEALGPFLSARPEVQPAL